MFGRNRKGEGQPITPPTPDAPLSGLDKINAEKVYQAMTAVADSYLPRESRYHKILEVVSGDIREDYVNEVRKDETLPDWDASWRGRGNIEGRIVRALATGDQSTIEVQVPRKFRKGLRRQTRQRHEREYRQDLQQAAARVVEEAMKLESVTSLIDEHLNLRKAISKSKGRLDFLRRNSADIGALIAFAAPIPLIGVPAFAIRGRINRFTQKEILSVWNGKEFVQTEVFADDKALKRAFNEYVALQPRVRLVGGEWRYLERSLHVKNSDRFADKVWQVKKIKGFMFASGVWDAMRDYIFATAPTEPNNLFAAWTEQAAYYRAFTKLVSQAQEERKQK